MYWYQAYEVAFKIKVREYSRYNLAYAEKLDFKLSMPIDYLLMTKGRIYGL